MSKKSSAMLFFRRVDRFFPKCLLLCNIIEFLKLAAIRGIDKEILNDEAWRLSSGVFLNLGHLKETPKYMHKIEFSMPLILHQKLYMVF